MKLDIRIPLGTLFCIFGLLLAGYGALADKSSNELAAGLNINLWWGIVLLGFGVSMLLLSWWASQRALEHRQ
jgi:hypothetical protein